MNMRKSEGIRGGDERQRGRWGPGMETCLTITFEERCDAVGELAEGGSGYAEELLAHANNRDRWRKGYRWAKESSSESRKAMEKEQ